MSGVLMALEYRQLDHLRLRSVVDEVGALSKRSKPGDVAMVFGLPMAYHADCRERQTNLAHNDLEMHEPLL